MIGLFDIILVEENIELLISSYTLPKTNISPENRGFPKGKLYSNHQLSGSMLVSGRVYHILRKLMKICIQSSLILLNEIRVDGHFLGVEGSSSEVTVHGRKKMAFTLVLSPYL